MKTCTICHQEKSNNAFTPTKKSKDGLSWECRSCKNEKARKSFKQLRDIPEHPVKCVACGETKQPNCFYRDGRRLNGLQGECQECQKNRTHAKHLKHPERYILSHAKQRAKDKGVPFALSEQDIVIPDVCPVLGIKLLPPHTSMDQRGSSASIDEIIPGLGYVPGNVAVISWRANSLKRDGTLAELEKVVEWLRGVSIRT